MASYMTSNQRRRVALWPPPSELEETSQSNAEAANDDVGVLEAQGKGGGEGGNEESCAVRNAPQKLTSRAR